MCQSTLEPTTPVGNLPPLPIVIMLVIVILFWQRPWLNDYDYDYDQDYDYDYDQDYDYDYDQDYEGWNQRSGR